MTRCTKSQNFATVIQTKKKLNAHLECFILEACNIIPKSQQKSSCMTFSARKIYRAAMSLNRYEWLLRTITFHDHNTVRADFLKDN